MPLPGPDIHPISRAFRYYLARLVAGLIVHVYVRPRLVGRERLPSGPYLICFNHLNWADPFILMAVLPWRPRLYFFGPREEDMRVGMRNRLMQWVGLAVPYRPAKDDLLGATRRVGAVIRAGDVIAIAGEGRIHADESIILPLNAGPAYFALRTGTPVVPVALSGTSWLAFRRTVEAHVGEPIPVSGRPTREAIQELTCHVRSSLQTLVEGRQERPAPGPFGRWVTELFNEWPEGARPEEASAGGSASGTD